MPGFSQINHPRSSAAVSAPSNRNVGRLRPARDWAAADDSRRSGHLPPSAVSLMTIHIRFERASRWAPTLAGYGIMKEARA
jgi:hypothetical protein